MIGELLGNIILDPCGYTSSEYIGSVSFMLLKLLWFHEKKADIFLKCI